MELEDILTYYYFHLINHKRWWYLFFKSFYQGLLPSLRNIFVNGGFKLPNPSYRFKGKFWTFIIFVYFRVVFKKAKLSFQFSWWFDDYLAEVLFHKYHYFSFCIFLFINHWLEYVSMVTLLPRESSSEDRWGNSDLMSQLSS